MTVAPWLFTAGGVLLAGIGAFFVFGRPPLLPEDLRLRRVFTVLGGHAFAPEV